MERKEVKMPLKHSQSEEALHENIAREIAEGKPQKQAVAIAYSVKNKAKKTNGNYDKSAISKALYKLGK